MAKMALVYSGDNYCYVTIAALSHFTIQLYSLLSWGLEHLRCLVGIQFITNEQVKLVSFI